MGYLLEWVVGSGGDNHCLIRQVRVFRNGKGLKAFLHSQHFRRHAGGELRIQIRHRDLRCEQVITSLHEALAWDPTTTRLPPALQASNWQRDVAAMGFRASLLQRMTVELDEARSLGLLSGDQTSTLISSLERMLTAKPNPGP